MRITIETTNDNPHLGMDLNKVTNELPDSSNIDEMMDALCGLLVAYGFAQESVKEGILSKAEEYGEEKDV